MQRVRTINPVLRAVGIIAAVAVLVTSVTFAALQSQATLTDSSVSTASVNLLIWDGDSFESTAPGFTITNLVPGDGSDPNMFYFKNSGGATMDLTVHVPTSPSASGFTGWENLKVIITNMSDPEAEPLETDMAALLAGDVPLPGAPLAPNAQGDSSNSEAPGNYSVVFDINPESIDGSQASVTNIDFVFTAMQHTTPTTNPDDDGGTETGTDDEDDSTDTEPVTTTNP
jgi:hypothetical protein